MPTHSHSLPLGVQNLAEIRANGHYYADKTPFIDKLIQGSKYYFLSRPRRFGKSLLVDTLKELFEGNKPLFEGLYIVDKWDWQKKHPVIRISFGSGTLKTRAELDTRIRILLEENAERLNLHLKPGDIAGQFSQLLTQAAHIHKAPVVLLIDEYDKPILDNITQSEAATDMREGLKNLYTCIKDADPYIKLCFITGVSKFSKVSLFSGLNNLLDITLLPEYSAICGYTDDNLDTVFFPETQRFNREDIKKWYNGYNWRGTCVYNPYDVLMLFKTGEFGPYWFETATPTFLVEMLKQRTFYTPYLAGQFNEYELLSQFDVDNIAVEALLFQSGYLTLKSTRQPFFGITEYELGYPNYEVEVSLNKALLPALGVALNQVPNTRMRLTTALKHCDFSALKQHFVSLLASIPHDWHRKNNLAEFEGHYASVFYSHFAAVGLAVQVEEAVATGKVDMVVEFNQTVFVFEFKMVASTANGSALAQLKAKNYAEKYKAQGWPIYLIGVEFSKKHKNVVGFDVETLG